MHSLKGFATLVGTVRGIRSEVDISHLCLKSKETPTRQKGMGAGAFGADNMVCSLGISDPGLAGSFANNAWEVMNAGSLAQVQASLWGAMDGTHGCVRRIHALFMHQYPFCFAMTPVLAEGF